VWGRILLALRGELELEPGPCQMVESPLYVETEAQGVQVRAHSPAARQSQNRNSNQQRDSPHTAGSSARCHTHPELNTEEGAAGFVFARGWLAYAQSAPSRLHVNAHDAATFVKEMTVLSLVGTEIGSVCDVVS